jgi:putative redox protein
MAKKEALVRHIQGVTFAAKADSGHWVMMDGPSQVGGSDAGARPKELILMALGGCTGSDVATILQKKRVPLEGLELFLSAEVAQEHPQVYTSIHVTYVVYGENINPVDVERAIELSTTKYCAVSAMLRASVNITHSFEIKTPRRLAAQTPSSVS